MSTKKIKHKTEKKPKKNSDEFFYDLNKGFKNDNIK